LCVRSSELRHNIPIRSAGKGHAFPLALHNQSCRHRLHTAGGQTRPDLAPQHRGQLVAVQAVKDTTGLLRIDHIGVDITGLFKGLFDGVLRDLVEHHALDRHLRLERFHQMPCDGLALTILISGEIKLIGFFQGGFQISHGLALVGSDDVVRLEPVIDVHAELAVMLLIGRRYLTGLREVTNMPHRCHDGIAVPQVSADLACLGRRLYDHKLAAVCHSLSLLLCFREP